MAFDWGVDQSLLTPSASNASMIAVIKDTIDLFARSSKQQSTKCLGHLKQGANQISISGALFVGKSWHSEDRGNQHPVTELTRFETKDQETGETRSVGDIIADTTVSTRPKWSKWCCLLSRESLGPLADVQRH